MRKLFLYVVIFLIVGIFSYDKLYAHGAEYQEFKIWTDVAPGEAENSSYPTLLLRKPKEKKSDVCMVIFPGGAYMNLAKEHEGYKISDFFASKGITSVVVFYRVPRREGVEKHRAAWQDAQRAIKFVRFHAKEWGIHEEKIGCMGFSAGGHLALMMATTSETSAYEGEEEVDKMPCHVNFAVPVYPAYVLEDGKNGPNSKKGNDADLVKDFSFDTKTPPMCLIHGDEDKYSAMGSVAVYHKLRTMNIPAELHIYAKIMHGFGSKPVGENEHVGDWLNRVYAWMQIILPDAR
ncbi:MAG: alpha/beta hydrolase [Planctomycetia bacterium]|nr:alpha/beta hydrolase [Planctomycetia bacterium]